MAREAARVVAVRVEAEMAVVLVAVARAEAARAVKPQRAVATEAAATAALPHYSHAPRCGCPSLLRARSPRGARGRAGRSRACADVAFRDQFAYVFDAVDLRNRSCRRAYF